MAEEKMTIVDLRKAIAKQTGVPEQVAGNFLTGLLESVTDGLKKDKSVKIGGLGTFKLQWVEPRKSVNISTGENIVIEGYNKLGFSPETSVKVRVNEPFANLEAVELDAEGNPVEATEAAKPFSPIDRFGEQALEIKGLLDDIAGGEAKEETPATEPEPEPEPVAEAPVVVEESEPEAVVEPKPEPIVEPEPVVEEPIVEPEPVVGPEPELVVEPEPEPVVEAPVEEEPKEEPKEEVAAPKERKPFRPWLVALITILVFAIALVVAYFFLQHKVEQWADQLNGKIQQAGNVEMPVEEEPVVVPDTLEVDTVVMEDSLMVEPTDSVDGFTTEISECGESAVRVRSTSADALSDFLNNENRTYEELKDVVTVAEGSRLTWISYKQYGRKDFWVFIYEANRDKLPKPSCVYVGMRLRIPKLPEELFAAANQERVTAYTKSLEKIYDK